MLSMVPPDERELTQPVKLFERVLACGFQQAEATLAMWVVAYLDKTVDDKYIEQVSRPAQRISSDGNGSGEIPATSRRIDVLDTLWYTCTGDQISAIRHHLDIFAMLQQLGAFEAAR
jgi:hypothetical protein